MDEPPHTRTGGGAHDDGRPVDVGPQHRPGIIYTERVDAGDVVDHRAPSHRRREGVLVEQVAANWHRAEPPQRFLGRARAGERHDLVAPGYEPLDERATDHAAAARDEDAAHESLRSADEKLMK